MGCLSDLLNHKGCFDGTCNRVGCHTTGAKYWNRLCHAYYCESCARWIDLDSVTDPTQPPRFEWPLTPDTTDRHKKPREQRYAADHPHQGNG